MKRSRLFAIGCVIWLMSAVATSAKSEKPLQIFFIDVEGGQSTLVVSPEQRSLLIDTGWAGGRDAERIAAAVEAAGLKRIDYVVVTHFHRDHVGGAAELASKVKIRGLVDHGSDVEDSAVAKETYADYEKLAKPIGRVTVRPGEGLPFQDIKVQFLAAAGELIHSPLPGAGEANPLCTSEKEPPPDVSENSQSLGLLISYGKFRFLDLGDLTENKGLALVCPNNLVGQIDLYLTTHHGAYPDNPKALVWAIQPRVAITNNGATKGGNPGTWQIVHDSPGLEDLWQLHYAVEAGKDHNSAENFIANTEEKSDGHFIQVTAWPDGAFVVRNSRNGFDKRYTVRSAVPTSPPGRK